MTSPLPSPFLQPEGLTPAVPPPLLPTSLFSLSPNLHSVGTGPDTGPALTASHLPVCPPAAWFPSAHCTCPLIVRVYPLPAESLTHLSRRHHSNASTRPSGLTVPLLTTLCFTQHWNAFCAQNTSYTFPRPGLCRPASQAILPRLTQTGSTSLGVPATRQNASRPHRTAP